MSKLIIETYIKKIVKLETTIQNHTILLVAMTSFPFDNSIGVVVIFFTIIKQDKFPIIWNETPLSII